MFAKYKDQKSEATTIEIIPQLITVVQEVIKKLLHSVLSEIPIAFVDSKSRIYVLVKDFNKDIEDFILNGKAGITELHLLSKKQKNELRKCCRHLGLKCTFHSQTLEYMRCNATIIYPQVKNQQTGVKVALIPWFMLPGRPFPIFAYVYGIWHYSTVEQTNMKLSAAATRDLFGTGSFDMSTLSRSIKAIGNMIDVSVIDKPLSANDTSVPSITELISCIPELLIACPTIESLRKAFGVKAVPLPPPINRKMSIPHILSNIPKYLSVAVSSGRLIKKGRCVVRKRHKQHRKKKEPCSKRKADFVETPEMKRIRLEFIAICKSIVINAAIGIHQVLI